MIVLLIAANCRAVVNQTKAQPTETPRFFYKGLLISDCTIPGEQKKDNIQPSNAISWQLSKNRWAWIYATTSFQGADSIRAVVIQLRKDTPDGQVLSEKLVAPFTDQWDPFKDGSKYFKQQGQCKIFGTPKGAVDKDGKLLPSNNVFIASWYHLARVLDHKTGRLGAPDTPEYNKLWLSTLRVAGVQFKLNDTESDIELLTPVTIFCQKGYENKDVFCELGNVVKTTNHWYVPFQPYNDACTQWLDYWQFSPDGQGVAPVLFEFNPTTKLYEWVKTGPQTKLKKGFIFECSVCKIPDGWFIGARGGGAGAHGGWFKIKDPFAAPGEPYLAPNFGPPMANQSTYYCGDGKLRVFGGDAKLSPFKWVRNPQYCWDIDPNNFALSNCKTLVSSDDVGMENAKMAKYRAFLSPVFQNRQIITVTISNEITGKMSQDQLDKCGVHYWYVTYDKDIKDAWTFTK